MIARLLARLRGVVQRAVVTQVNDARGLQEVQIMLMADQGADDVERFQNYGFTSVPHAGAEGVKLAVGASAGHTVVVAVDDRRYRLKGMAAGEVAVYDDLDHAIHLTRNGIVIHGGGHAVTLRNLSKLRVEADIESTGSIKDLCDSVAGRTMEQMRDTHDAHTHTTTTGGQPTSTPNQAG